MLEKPDTTMDDLLARTTNLTVLDEEGWEVNTVGGTEVASFCAMGRLCSNRPMSRSLFKTILGRVWGISERDWGVEIKLTTKKSSFLVFSFKSSQDLDRILTKNPWFLNNGFLIVERLDGIPQDWDKLPTRSITQGNLERLAGYPGEVIEVQKVDISKIVTKEFFTFKASFFRVRVERFGSHSEPVKFFEDGLGNQLPRYGSWLKVDDRRDLSASSSQGSSSRFAQTTTPPRFPVKGVSHSDVLPTNPGKVNAGSSSSLVCPELLPRKVAGSVVTPTITGLGFVEKSKEVGLADPTGLIYAEQQAHDGNSSSGGHSGMERVREGLCNAKRSGSWRDERLIACPTLSYRGTWLTHI
ncbi:hypothetical protein G4B88_018627 [Cannabis sativa]|uniref:DUF4283 domain-containing protein n=1 Tax=Cannabis sativa TaxID=3483 RepID=A0A7J6HGN5_CANSA|nr:hypothetical protein G4B88_018627 [Cannabis sativa]